MLNETSRKPSSWKLAVKKAVRPFVRKIGLDFTHGFGDQAPPQEFANPEYFTISPDELQLLLRLVKEASLHPGPIVEIGTLFGITASHMALVKRPDQKIITVDNYSWNPWGLTRDRHLLLAKYVLNNLIQTGHVEQINMGKNDFYNSYQGPPPALVFLDADHSYGETKKDIEWAQRIGARTIAGHDYYAGVKQVVDECGGPRERASALWVL